jgi:hypothetical protein
VGRDTSPLLRGVPDAPDNNDANPNFKWSLDMSYSTFESKLNSAYGVGSVHKFTPVKPFGVSGRVTVVTPDNTGGVRIVGSKKTERVSGRSIRSALALKDSLFRVQITYDVDPEMVNKYRRLDRAPGDPTSDPYRVPIGSDRSKGRAQDFQKGRLTWRRSTDKTVSQHGPVLRKYNGLGREKSDIGMPTSDIWGPGRYLGGSYVNGLILWSENTDAHSIKGRFRKAFTSAGGADGHLGLPTTQQVSARSLPDGGKVQRFVSGSIYLNPTAGAAYALWGDFDSRYRALGQAAGTCGYPISSVTGDEGIRQALFENGSMQWTAATGLEVNCG